jgi:ribosome maturation factor RimP
MSTYKDDIQTAVAGVAEPLVQGRGLALLRVTVRGTEQNPVIEVILDGNRQIEIQDCEAISRDLNETLEGTKLVKGNFRLDVMSPGVEEPLQYDYQFERAVGRLVEIEWEHDGTVTTSKGYLKTHGPVLTVETAASAPRRSPSEPELLVIPRESVRSVKLQIDFKGRG